MKSGVDVIVFFVPGAGGCAQNAVNICHQNMAGKIRYSKRLLWFRRFGHSNTDTNNWYKQISFQYLYTNTKAYRYDTNLRIGISIGYIGITFYRLNHTR